MTTGEIAKAPALFLRNATGLVKGWSGFDAFNYSFMSVNLVTLGMFYSLAIFAYVPDGSAIASIVVTAIGMTFMCIAYAGLIAVMPRAGGDYVWQWKGGAAAGTSTESFRNLYPLPASELAANPNLTQNPGY